MHRLLVPLVIGVLATASPPADAAPPAGTGPVRVNELQVIGTHNSYKRELSEAEQAAYDEIIATPGDYDAFLAYSHTAIPNQFARQDVRGLELDLFPDPRGGLYTEPLVRTRLGLGPLPDPAWRQPGVKQGYLVRTRSDLPLSTVTSGDTDMLDAALRSGAHVISTDFPEIGMSARYGSDYVAALPDGGPVRCNPVTARPGCVDDRLEPPR
jgi:Phosphoinositide phospholipase C, Ca2+-dependent